LNALDIVLLDGGINCKSNDQINMNLSIRNVSVQLDLTYKKLNAPSAEGNYLVKTDQIELYVEGTFATSKATKHLDYTLNKVIFKSTPFKLEAVGGGKIHNTIAGIAVKLVNSVKNKLETKINEIIVMNADKTFTDKFHDAIDKMPFTVLLDNTFSAKYSIQTALCKPDTNTLEITIDGSISKPWIPEKDIPYNKKVELVQKDLE
jgi:hypothetical protein